MFKFVSAAVTAAFLALPASAAVIDLPFGTAEYFETEGWSDLVISNDFALIDVLDGTFEAFVSLSYDAANPTGDFFGDILLSSGAETVVSGVLSGFDVADGSVLLAFDELSGSQADLFGGLLSMDLAFLDLFEANPLASLVDGESYAVAGFAAGAEAPAPVPLPAGIVLLGSGLAALALKRRRR